MSPQLPYQPSLLRLLHGTMVVLVPLTWLSGFLVYSNFDGRWGRMGWSVPGNWIDIHGSFGVLLWPLALLFGLYALSIGRARLNRAANAAALLGLILAVGSGKLMEEDWLRDGQLGHIVYSLHLLAWLLIAGAVFWHLAAVMRKGGTDLATSVFQLKVRNNDLPQHWPSQILRWFRNYK